MVWRPLPEAGDGDAGGSGDVGRGPRPLEASLRRLAAGLGAPAPGVLSAVFAQWDEVVGPEVAAHARPVRLRAGVLVVEVDQPAWATQLNYLKGDLARRIEVCAGPGQVVEIRVRVAQPKAPERSPAAGRRPVGW
ncbi:MAG: DciA family protein [Acidimicrobiales bacterium]